MRLKMQPKVKKYTAALLVLSIVGGCMLGVSGIETKAQERTLPGIEKLVAEYVASGETFQVLEIVPEKKDASFGYLIGGQEPVYDGKKLSQMTSVAERALSYGELELALGSMGDLLGNDSLVTYEKYEEGTGDRSQEIRGQFVEGSGDYNYMYAPTTYRPLEKGETTQVERFDRIFYCEEENQENQDKPGVAVTFSYIDGGNDNSNHLSMVWGTVSGGDVSGGDVGYTNKRYNLYTSESIADVEENFVPEDYIGQDVYINSSDTTYTYFGYVEAGTEIGELTIRRADNSEEASNQELNLYIVNSFTQTAYEWAIYGENGYSFEADYMELAGGEFVGFVENSTNGDYYISKALNSEHGKWRILEEYQSSESGAYVVETKGHTNILYATEEGFDADNTYYFIEDSTGEVFDTVAYKGGFYSNEWFKKHVLNLSGNSSYEKTGVNGEEMDSMNVEVKTLTMTELMDLVNNDGYYGIHLEDVDLIYLSGQGNYWNYGSGVEEAALRIAKMAYGVDGSNQRVPVVMDYQFYEENKASGNEVLTKLALMLLQVDNESACKLIEAADASLWSSADMDITVLHEAVNRQMAEEGISIDLSNDTLTQKEYVSESVYLNDDTYSPFVSKDFLTDFTDESMRDKGHDVGRFTDVLDEIAYENFLYEKDASGAADLLEEKVNKASIIRYIMNWSAHRVTVKSSLSILDLEPCYDFDGEDTLNEEGVKTFMNQADYSGTIEITQMASAEFIGKIEDLNEKYDLIYVGARTGMMNTDKDGQTIYNDEAMNGLIYTHTGDVYSYKKNEYNKVVNEETASTWRLRDDSIGYYDYYRAPGNDMNSTREEEFEQFIEAGYPVVFADELLNIDGDKVTVNNETVDCYSYFDALIDFALSKDEDGNYKYWQRNVYAESQLIPQSGEKEAEMSARQARHTRFCKYLNLSKLTVSWVTNLGEEYIPVEYEQDSNGNMSFLRPKNGVYTLQFIFSLANDSALSQVSCAYDCKLYVDNNSDGRFTGSDYSVNQTSDSTEELTGLTIYVRKDNNWELVSPVSWNDESRYQLYTGNTYKVVRQLPDDYQGAIPWKLVFYDNEDPLVRTAQSGYTAVNRENLEKTIRILQLKSDKGLSAPKYRWDLEEDDELQNLLKQVPGFNIEIVDESDEVSDFIASLVTDNGRWSTEQRYEEYYTAAKAALNKYDMIIMGFGDNYTFGVDGKETANMAVAAAVRDYIESGRSVLFTHDSSSYINTNDSEASSYGWYWGYEFNKTMRAAVGLDRYGALQLYYEDMRDRYTEGSTMWNHYNDYLEILQTQYDYDTVYRPESGAVANANPEEDALPQVEGITKFTLVRYMYEQLERFTGENDTDFLFPINNKVFWKAINRQNGTTNYASFVDGQYSWSGMPNSSTKSGPDLVATQVNEGQITTYPFEINEDLLVKSTHYQWLQPNMELDKDNDGKNDIVVWYTLSDVSSDGSPKQETNIYEVNPKDVVNNYYIYNMGNVTYSGAGHTEPTNIEEKKLFVNTMVAAYAAGVKSPSVTVKNDANENTDSFYMLYDPVNKLVLNGQQNVKVRFMAVDYNVLSGESEIRVDIYKACNSSNESEGIQVEGIVGNVLQVDSSRLELKLVANSLGESVPVVEVNPVVVTEENSFNGYFPEKSESAEKVYYSVDNNMTYELSLSCEELGLFTVWGDRAELLADAAADTFYIRATTVYENGTERTDGGVQQFQVSAAELFDLK